MNHTVPKRATYCNSQESEAVAAAFAIACCGGLLCLHLHAPQKRRCGARE